MKRKVSCNAEPEAKGPAARSEFFICDGALRFGNDRSCADLISIDQARHLGVLSSICSMNPEQAVPLQARSEQLQSQTDPASNAWFSVWTGEDYTALAVSRFKIGEQSPRMCHFPVTLCDTDASYFFGVNDSRGYGHPSIVISMAKDGRRVIRKAFKGMRGLFIVFRSTDRFRSHEDATRRHPEV